MKTKKCIVTARMKAFDYRKGGILSSDIYRSYKSDGPLIKKQQKKAQENTYDLKASLNHIAELLETRAVVRLDIFFFGSDNLQ